MNNVEALLAFADGVTYDALPAAAVDASRVFLADAISVGIAGSTEASAARVREAAGRWGHGDAATVLGTRSRLPAASAAFVNSFQVHCQEFDPLHEAATVHAMAVLTGALLAVAETRDASGADLLLGTAVGVEVAVTLGLAAREGLRFFRPATAGALGTTVALAKLTGLDLRASHDALGLAYSQLAGTMQAHVEGSVALPVQIAHAARAAVTAVDLAGAGLDGPRDVLDGPFGYFALYEREGDITPWIDTLGKPWRVTELSHKPFPTGRAAHAMLDAARRLKAANGFAIGDVRRITVTVPPLIRRLVDRPPRRGMTVNYARLCLPFLLARLLRDGSIDADTFTRAVLDDEELAAFGERLTFVEDAGHGRDVLSPQTIEIDLDDGRQLGHHVPHTLGSPQNPLDGEQRADKFRHAVRTAGVAAAPLEQALAAAGPTTSARELLGLTVPPA